MGFPFDDLRFQIGILRKLYQYCGMEITVWSSRVQLAGRSEERKLLRHYFARALVTCLAMRLKFTIYDILSGMKILPFIPTVTDCMKEKFKTRWFIELEIFLRWRFEASMVMTIWKEPLLGWKDIGGSKLSGKQYLTVPHDIRKLNSYEAKILKHHP